MAGALIVDNFEHGCLSSFSRDRACTKKQPPLPSALSFIDVDQWTRLAVEKNVSTRSFWLSCNSTRLSFGNSIGTFFLSLRFVASPSNDGHRWTRVLDTICLGNRSTTGDVACWTNLRLSFRDRASSLEGVRETMWSSARVQHAMTDTVLFINLSSSV